MVELNNKLGINLQETLSLKQFINLSNINPTLQVYN